MTSNEMEECLKEARSEFDKPPEEENIENGLNTNDATELQLKKACRLLKASKELLEKDSYYILVIDACFTAIERSIQARLYEVGAIDEGKAIFDHERIYEEGRMIGIYDGDFEESLKRLWSENRSKNYYREGIPSRERAEKMYNLATSVHSHIMGMSSNGHKCLCE
jgi:hypothetical protein